MSRSQTYDIAIIGGGVNGCAIARDAAGRGLSVFLSEARDLAGATSSASTKLFHGGLRYLEYYDFALVRHALIERELLLRAMPHIAHPLRFVLPYHSGLRPAWLLRLGLFIYDHLDFRPGHRKMLPGTTTIDLGTDPAGAPLKPGYKKGFEYSDGWVDDARLVVLNAMDAAQRGAEIAVRTRTTAARREKDHWIVSLQDTHSGQSRQIAARALVNAGGPWVGNILQDVLDIETSDHIRLVRGSHIVVNRLFEHDRAYIFQQGDGRIIFAIPYEDDFTLIGTTDVDHDAPLSEIACSPDEAEYLCRAASEYFRAEITAKDIVWTYSGVRPLYDNGASSASAVTRDYVLKREGAAGQAPLLNVFGGKITTHRHLAYEAMQKLAPDFALNRKDWTRGLPLPGGDFKRGSLAAEQDALLRRYPFLEGKQAHRLLRAYGTLADKVLGQATSIDDLGRDFGAGLTEAEIRYMIDREWARSTEDILWRRSKLGLRLSAKQTKALDTFVTGYVATQFGTAAASADTPMAPPQKPEQPQIQPTPPDSPPDGAGARLEMPGQKAG